MHRTRTGPSDQGWIVASWEITHAHTEDEFVP